MLKCSCTKCGHKWEHSLGITRWVGGKEQPHVIECMACEAGGIEQLEAQEKASYEVFQREERSRAVARGEW